MATSTTSYLQIILRRSRMLILLVSFLFIASCSPVETAQTQVEPTLSATPTQPALRPVATHTPTLTHPATPTNPPTQILTPRPTSPPTATPPPSSTPTKTPVPYERTQGDYMLFFRSSEPACERGGGGGGGDNSHTPTASVEPKYGLYQAYRQDNGTWATELIHDGFYIPRVTLSPDKKHIAIITYKTDIFENGIPCYGAPITEVDLKVFDIQTGLLRTLPIPPQTFYFAWSPDSQKITYQNKNNMLLQADVATLEVQELVQLPGTARIAQSAKGIIALAIDYDGEIQSPHLYFLDTETLELDLIHSVPPPSTGGNFTVNISWSPDGTWLAYDATGFPFSIIRFDKQEEIEVSEYAGHYIASWSPTSEKMVFVGNNKANEKSLFIWSQSGKSYSPLIGYPYIPLDKWANEHNWMTMRIEQEFFVLKIKNSGVSKEPVKYDGLKIGGIYQWLPDDERIILTLLQEKPDTNQNKVWGLYIQTPDGELVEHVLDFSPASSHINNLFWIENK